MLFYGTIDDESHSLIGNRTLEMPRTSHKTVQQDSLSKTKDCPLIQMRSHCDNLRLQFSARISYTDTIHAN